MAEAPIQASMLGGYQAARTGHALWRLPQPGYLWLGGETRLDFLQRQTSNDMQLLAPERAVPNVLTAATGRILEVFTVIEDGQGYGLLTPQGHAPGLAAYFNKRIFFNDQVVVEDRSTAWAQFELHGPQAAETLQVLGLDQGPTLNEVLAFDWQGQQLRALGIPGLTAETGYRLLAPAAAADELEQTLLAEGAESLGAEAVEVLRVEAGQAGPPEFNGDYTPFEVGLSERVSETKGCYTGQEVLARQVTYDKVTRQLARLACEQMPQPGSPVQAEGKTVGSLTSLAQSPQQGALALAVLRKPHHQAGTQVSIVEGGQSIPAEVI